MVSVLYVRQGSIYSTLPDVDVWGVDRDADLFTGPGPVVAHPPCGHWGKYSAVCRQPGAGCAPIAMASVRRCGGVLEHPLGSRLFPTLGVPSSGHDLWGGRLLSVNQCDWGHLAQKPTLLYFVGCEPGPLPRPRTPARKLESLSRLGREGTPPDFARWLVECASQVNAALPRKS